MQTFMPHPDFAASAACLDYRRLGKQRVEGLQILNALDKGGAWRNHPAVKMWTGYRGALARYILAVCREWIGRGYKDTIAPRIETMIEEHPEWNHELPYWMGNEEFHLSHKSNLVRKDPEFYGPQFEGVGPDLPYFWPMPENEIAPPPKKADDGVTVHKLSGGAFVCERNVLARYGHRASKVWEDVTCEKCNAFRNVVPWSQT